MYALDAQVGAMGREGVEKRWRRHADMAKMTSDWIDECRSDGIDVENIVKREYRSPTVSTIRLPVGVESTAFLPRVASRGITVATGYGKLRAPTFRIGHMGDHSTATLARCLDACRAALIG
jgi:aspartate aminotransferase-like enzyme